VIYSPVDTAAELTLKLQPYGESRDRRLLVFSYDGGYDHRQVRRAVAGTPASSVPLSGQTTIHVPVGLARGLTTAVLLIDSVEGADLAPGPVTVRELAVEPSPD
jgi:hypothetical protein